METLKFLLLPPILWNPIQIRYDLKDVTMFCFWNYVSNKKDFDSRFKSSENIPTLFFSVDQADREVASHGM